MQTNVYDSHQAVLLSEAVAALMMKVDGIYIDCTFGRGGHCIEILKRLGSDGRILALDQDPQAIAYGKNLFSSEKRVLLEQCNFSEIFKIANKYRFGGKVNGILFDLGVSSPQLDDPKRGFSFMHDGPLDMRMNNSEGPSAAQWLQTVSVSELEKVLKNYGQERYAKKIAVALIHQRDACPLETTRQLADLVQKVIGRSREQKHPATRTFQAIRIFINKEIDVLESALNNCVELLEQSGRLLVITFHSLEDRLVKKIVAQTQPLRFTTQTTYC